MDDRKRELWSETVGERGNRVRVYEVSPGSLLYRSVFVNGKENRKSLRHRDKKRARKDARALVVAMEKNDAALETGALTLGVLVELYKSSPSFAAKKETTQAADRKRLDRIVNFLGATRQVQSLCNSDVLRYTNARANGDEKLLGLRKHKKAVRPRSIHADLVALNTALHWGMREKTANGQRLLRENPWFGVAFPKELNPARPVMPHNHFLKLLEVAAEIHPYLAPALVIAEGTARRLSAVRQLRWENVDFSANVIHWPGKTDKKGYDHTPPIADAVRQVLKAWVKDCPTPEGWVFPLPTDYSKPCDRHRFSWWIEQAYKKAGLKREYGGAWHPTRRKFATERKHHPLKDVAEAGGWKDTRALLACYTQTDAATVRHVVENPIRLVTEG